MRIACLNPQGNFDPKNSRWTEHPDFGGQLVYVKELSLALERLGQRVDIITRQIEDPDWPEFAGARDRYPGSEHVRILRFPCGPARFLQKEDLWPFLGEWVEKILEFYDDEGVFPELFTGHYADGGLASALIQNLRGIPFTFTGHSLGAQKMDKIIGQREEFARAVRTFHFDSRIAAERVSMARAARIITSTVLEREEQYAHRLYRDALIPRRQGKFSVIPPGVNVDIFGWDRRSDSETQTARKVEQMLARDLPRDRQQLSMVICSSRLDGKKNHLGLVRAWLASDQLRKAANLLIITRGISDPLHNWADHFQGEEREVFGQIVRLIREGGIEDCLSAFDLNSQEELAACYRYLSRNKRGIFALSSHYEPFGLAPLEAMASGLPAVVTRNGGPRESLQDESGIYGILVDPEDPQDIARGLLELVQDEECRRDMGERGRQRVLDRYTWTRTAQGYLREFHKILAGEEAGSSGCAISEEIDQSRLEKLYYGNGAMN
jgi:sucrose-phosphate synthase